MPTAEENWYVAVEVPIAEENWWNAQVPLAERNWNTQWPPAEENWNTQWPLAAESWNAEWPPAEQDQWQSEQDDASQHMYEAWAGPRRDNNIGDNNARRKRERGGTKKEYFNAKLGPKKN